MTFILIISMKDNIWVYWVKNELLNEIQLLIFTFKVWLLEYLKLHTWLTLCFYGATLACIRMGMSDGDCRRKLFLRHL